MTESEYKKQNERMLKYKDAQDKISIIEKKKGKICSGIISIECEYDNQVDFDCLGESFKERPLSCIADFLDSEIETIKKSMEDI